MPTQQPRYVLNPFIATPQTTAPSEQPVPVVGPQLPAAPPTA